MPELMIPKQTLEQRSFQGKNGPVSVWKFRAIQDSIEKSCEVIGAEHKATLEAAMASGQPLTADKMEWNDKGNCHRVWLPRASGGAYSGGGKRPWSERGYKGQPIPQAEWIATTNFLLKQIIGGLKAAVGLDALDPKSYRMEVVAGMAEQARSLVASYWIAVQDNLTYVPGYGPGDAATGGGAEAAAPRPDHQKLLGPAPAGGYSPQMAAHLANIDLAQTIAEVDACMADARADTALTPVEKPSVLAVAMKKKRGLTPAE